MQKKEVHVISHTHWDREWYLTFEQFRIRLVGLIDHLLEIIEKEPKYRCFMLDGQTVLLEDYFTVKPWNKEKIKKYVKEGRILIGPWYVLPDEFLPGGESHIRNLLLGDKLCREFGGKMREGYLPDSFGHIAQMPQILKGFGIESAIFWRGVSNKVKTTEFIWQAPDGSEVFTLHLPFGYCSGAALPLNLDTCTRRIKNLVEKLATFATTHLLLIMNGCDHLEPQAELPRILSKINERLPDINLVQSDLPAFIRKIRKEVSELPRFKGEWRSGERAAILSGTTSTRIYLKQTSQRVETLLQRWVEPFTSFSWLTGNPYPESLIWQAWRYLLQNHAHDSICGCAVDEVHREVMERFSKAGQIGEGLCQEALHQLARKVDTSNKGRVNLIVFNPLQYTRTETIEVRIDLDERLIRKVDWEAGKIKSFNIKESSLPRGIKVRDAEGRSVPCHLKKVEVVEKLRFSPGNLPQVYLATRCHLSLWVKDLPGLGYRTFSLEPGPEKEGKGKLEKFVNFILENEYLKVIPHPQDGSLTIYDKETGKKYQGCNVFSDGGDAGDEYTYSPPEEDKVLSTRNRKAKIEWEENNPTGSILKIQTSLDLPLSLTEDRKKRSSQTVICPITSYISVYPGVKRVDVKTVIENRARDHRLRVLFPSDIQTNTCFAETHFQVMSRNIGSPQEKVWVEKYVGTSPQKSFVDLNDGRVGLTIANRGLPEYEVMKEEGKATIALTLLRCVGWLSREDLLTRKGHAGWSLPTPEAQCLGQHTFEYSIIPHRGSWEEAKSYIQAHSFNVPFRWAQTEKHPGELPSELSFFRIYPDNLVVSAIKKEEDGDSIILRIYNTTSSPCEGILYSYFPLREARIVELNERFRQNLRVDTQNRVRFKAKEWQIVTLQLIAV